jgi:hypothetical protein
MSLVSALCRTWCFLRSLGRVDRCSGNTELIEDMTATSMAVRKECQPALCAYREDCKVVTAPSDERWQIGGLESFMLRPKRARLLRIFTALASPKWPL